MKKRKPLDEAIEQFVYGGVEPQPPATPSAPLLPEPEATPLQRFPLL